MEPKPVKSYINKEVLYSENNPDHKSSNHEIGSSFIAQLEWGLMLSADDSIGCDWSEAHDNYVHISHYDKSWLMSADSIGREEMGVLKPWTLSGDVSLQSDISFFDRINIKTCTIPSNKSFIETPPTFRRLREINKLRTKHVDYKKFSKVLELSVSHYNEKINKWISRRDWYGVLRSRVKGIELFIPVSSDPKYVIGMTNESLKEDFQINASYIYLLLNLQLTEYYEWFVYFTDNTSKLSFKIAIDPCLSKNIFKLRDVPEGKNRRAAIVNFVKEHLRANSNKDKDYKSLVKEHLRGKNQFIWNGFTVGILPAIYDLKRLELESKPKWRQSLK